MISARLKNLIFDYILKDLYNVEIIYYRDSIWFIDRENRYWYIEYHKVDKHLWWRWSRFTSALNMFSMEAEEKQYLFGDLVNMILTKKQKLESKYPNKIFKTVGSVMNFEDNDEVGLKNEVKTTKELNFPNGVAVDKVLNCEVKTTRPAAPPMLPMVDKLLNCEVKTTSNRWHGARLQVDEVLNCEVKTTEWQNGKLHPEVDEVLNYEVKTTADYSHCSRPVVDEVLNSVSSAENGADYIMDFILTDGVFYNDEIVTNEVLNYDVEKIHEHRSPQDILVKNVLEFSIETTKSGELIEEDKIMDDVLEIQNIQPTERGVNDMVDFVLEVEDYQAWNGKQETKVTEVLENTIEINSIEKLKGENPFQDVVVSHILDESDKVTDKLVIKEEEYVKTFSHDVYMCDHLVQNVLDVGVNSIHYDAEPHTQLVDGILKKSYNL
jgi:hypothetical protein